MQAERTVQRVTGRGKCDEIFNRLGLRRVAAGPIVDALRRANQQWLAERRQRIEEHSARIRVVLEHELGIGKRGRRRRIVCVELQREFASMAEAARFVRQRAANIARALKTGGRCGRYHWEEERHEGTKAQRHEGERRDGEVTRRRSDEATKGKQPPKAHVTSLHGLGRHTHQAARVSAEACKRRH